MASEFSPFKPRLSGFTLVELLTVMAIIAILAGLILSISGYANKKAASSRATSEVQALSTACESYKADNGTYPRNYAVINGGTSSSIYSDLLDPRTSGNSASTNTAYTYASLQLYEALSGDLLGTGSASTTNYIPNIKPDMFGRSQMTSPVSSSNPVTYLSDPFGNSYGYSTANYTTVTTGSSPIQGYSPPTTMPGYNPTFDLWSTGGQTSNPNPSSTAGQPGDPALQWIKNW